MTVQRELSKRNLNGNEGFRIDAWALCAEFVERIVSDTRSTVEGEQGQGYDVDWEAIWRAGDGAPSDEAAIGRIVLAASKVARGFDASNAPRALLAPIVTGQPDGSLSRAGTPASPSADQVLAPTEEISTGQDPGAAQSGQQVAQPEPTHEEFGPELAGAELATVSVEADPGVIDSLTVVQPTSPTQTNIGSVGTEELPIETVVPIEGVSGVASTETELESLEISRDISAHSGWYDVFTWMRNVGVIVLLFVAWQLWGTSIAQHHAQLQLKSEFEAAVRGHHVPPQAGEGKGRSLIPATTNFASPADGSVVARLQIPAIGVDQYVVSGTSSDDLAKGPGHYVGTALPGQAGNVAIAGHRTTHGAPFNGLGNLRSGDRIILTTTWGESLTYVVVGTPQAVSPSDVGVLNYFGDNRITLTTCNPEFSSTQRLIVVGRLRQPLAPVAMPAHVAYHVENSGTADWNWSLLPAVGIEVCLLLLLALSHRRFDGLFARHSKWIIIVPLWAAGLYLLFGTLTSFLPSSI